MINSIEINISNGPIMNTIAIIDFNENICYKNNIKYSINNVEEIQR